MKSLIKPGRYRHYKGRDYRVLGTVRHSETEEDLVLYFPLYGDNENNDIQYWVRPLAMFNENVSEVGKTVPRFEYIGEGK